MVKTKKIPILICFKDQPTQNSAVESNVLPKIQLMKTGIFSYWEKDDTVITAQLFDDLIRNFQNNVRGIECAIGYGHPFDEAAGWIKSLEKDPTSNELLAEVKWTPPGKQCLDDEVYKYISVEFNQNYIDEAGRECGPTLYGAGLTNRPFLKGMKPISEMEEFEEKNRSETMTPEEKKKMDDQEKELKALREANEKTRALSEKKIRDLENEKIQTAENAKKESVFDKLLVEGSVVEAQRIPYMNNDMVKFAENAGKVNLKAKGHSDITNESDGQENYSALTPDQAEDKLLELSERLSKEKNISFGDASKIIIFENKELAKKREEKFSFSA